MNKKIVTLTGFMGCGKTHVSKILAEELGFDVIDSDKEIEKVKKKTIPQIMAEVGEFGFRKIESEAVTTPTTLVISASEYSHTDDTDFLSVALPAVGYLLTGS